MKKIIVFCSIICFTMILFSSCKKSCECKLWTNNTIGQPYSVVLEGDGSICSDYTTLDTLGGLVSGIECYDNE